MQGRLLSKVNGRYQAHPTGSWETEFPIAAHLGLDCIEFIFDFNDYEENPLWSVEGNQCIKTVKSSTGIEVYSICADFFMECPLHSSRKEIREFSFSILLDLLQICNYMEVSNLVLPCLDQSSLSSSSDTFHLMKQIQVALPNIEKYGVNLALETNLPPRDLKVLIDSFNSEFVTVNYDTGNSASLGYDFREELETYGSRISNIHIKDRTFSGGPVLFGKGDFDFKEFFKELDLFGFTHPLIMQLYRDENGLESFKKQFGLLKKSINS
jgi:sugar phosphate isomerase/epimerase